MAQSTSKITLWIALFAIAALAGVWVNFFNPVADKALAQTTGSKSPTKAIVPKGGGNVSGSNPPNSNKTSSLNNGPQSQPKATIQSIPVIQQRVPIKPRT